ncbi:MAG: hypothetical protein U1F21_03480 [Sphaerotilus natans]
MAAHTEKSVEALMLYLAILRAGFVYLPLNTAYQAAELDISSATPSWRWWSAPAGNFPWISQLRLPEGRGTCLHAERRSHRHAARPRRAFFPTRTRSRR